MIENYNHVEKGYYGEYFYLKGNDRGLILHRLDGPAISLFKGGSMWWYYGKHIECKSQEEFERFLKLKAFW